MEEEVDGRMERRRRKIDKRKMEGKKEGRDGRIDEGRKKRKRDEEKMKEGWRGGEKEEVEE